jgi:hypothetical protein
VIPAPSTQPFPSASPEPSINPHYATDLPRATIEVASGEAYHPTHSPLETRTTAPPSSLVVSTPTIAESATTPDLSTPIVSHRPSESERNEVSHLSNQPNAAQEGDTNDTPFLVVSVVLILVMSALFALLIYKEHGHNELLRQLEEKKEKQPDKAVPLNN